MKFQVLSYGTRDNPWGRALLDRLYWVWYLKRHASKFWALFVERFAQPLTKGTYPFKPDQDILNKENEDRLLAILNSIRTGSSIALPEGLDITFLEATRGGDASYSSFVSWLERAEGLLMLGEVDTSGLAKGAGSFAKALISNEVRLETVQHDAHLLGSFESDTLVRWLVLLNFGPDAPVPKSVYDDSDAADRNQRMQGITKALNDGVAVPLGYYRMTMRIPAPFDNEPVVERQPKVEAVSPSSPSSLSSLLSFSSLSSVPSPGALVEARDNQLQAVATHFAPALTSYFAAQLERLLALLDEETTAGPLDRLVAGNTPAAVVDAIQTAQIHGGGLALLHAREDLGALRLASEADRAAVGGARTERNCLSPKGEFEHRPQPAHTPRPSLVPDGWSGALTPTSAIDFWAAHLGHAKDFLLNLSGAAHRIATASAALAEGPLLTDLHEVLERAKAAGLDRATVRSRLRQTYEAHGLLPSGPHHADLVMASNIQQAAHAVRYTQLVDNPAAIRQVPYLVWWTVGDDRVRHRLLHNHVVMHARVFSIDHAIWKTWWPPAGFNCRCGIGTISVEEAQRLGLVGSEPTGPWPTAPGTGGPALPDPGFQGAPALATVAEHLTAQTHRIYLDAQAQGGDLLAAITRLFTTLDLLPTALPNHVPPLPAGGGREMGEGARG